MIILIDPDDPRARPITCETDGDYTQIITLRDDPKVLTGTVAELVGLNRILCFLGFTAEHVGEYSIDTPTQISYVRDRAETRENVLVIAMFDKARVRYSTTSIKP